MLYGNVCIELVLEFQQRQIHRPTNFSGRISIAPTNIFSAFFLEELMAKGYWVTFYRSISNPAALAEYAEARRTCDSGRGRPFSISWCSSEGL